MATVWDHLSVEELEERFVGCEDATASRHFQVIWLLARGHTISQVSGTTAYGERWIEQLLARYNAEGPEALGDLRRRNGAPATILKPDLLAKLRLRLDDPPPDGGLWSSRKVAAWMAGELNLTSVAPQRGWEALKAIGWSIQKPRPKNPKSATPEEAAAFKNVWPAPSASDFVEDAFVQSASTYPASGSCPRPRWRSARPGPHKTLGVERHFLNQGSSTPFDCQAISLPPLANIVSPSTHQSRCQADSYANMGASLAAKCCPCRRTAHEMRASLLASATTATFG